MQEEERNMEESKERTLEGQAWERERERERALPIGLCIAITQP